MTEVQLLQVWAMRPKLLTRARNVLGLRHPHETAEDMVTETMIRLLKCGPVRTNLAAYASRAITNVCLGYIRSRVNRSESNLELMPDCEQTTEMFEQWEMREFLARDVLKQFDPKKVANAWPHGYSQIEPETNTRRAQRRRALASLKERAWQIQRPNLAHSHV